MYEAVRERPFLDGVIVRVDFEDEVDEDDEDDDGKRFAWVYLKDDMEQVLTDDDVVEFVCNHPPEVSGLQSLAKLFIRTSGVASLLAVAIVATIIFLTLQHSQAPDYKPPDVLSDSLTLILGFYFGAAATKVRGS